MFLKIDFLDLVVKVKAKIFVTTINLKALDFKFQIDFKFILELRVDCIIKKPFSSRNYDEVAFDIIV